MKSFDTMRRLIKAADEFPGLEKLIDWREKKKVDTGEISAHVWPATVDHLMRVVHKPYRVYNEHGAYFRDSYGEEFSAVSCILIVKGKDEPQPIKLEDGEERVFAYSKLNQMSYLDVQAIIFVRTLRFHASPTDADRVDGWDHSWTATKQTSFEIFKIEDGTSFRQLIQSVDFTTNVSLSEQLLASDTIGQKAKEEITQRLQVQLQRLGEEFYYKDLHEHQPEKDASIPGFEIGGCRVSFSFRWSNEPPRLEIHGSMEEGWASLKLLIEDESKGFQIQSLSGRLPAIEKMVGDIITAWQNEEEREKIMRTIRFETEKRALGRR